MVYTVLFDVTGAAVETMLRNCASQPSMAFVADDSAELLASFNKISKSLTQFRLKN